MNKKSFLLSINDRIDPSLEKIAQHPFLRELSDGTLPKTTFHRYLVQDHYYLLAYAKALSTLADVCEKNNDCIFFNVCAEACLHEPAFDIRNAIVNQTVLQNRACSNYIHFFQKNILDGFLSGLSAVFPCFYVYYRISDRLYPKRNNNPYISWFDIYTGDIFKMQTEKVCDILSSAVMQCGETEKKKLLDIIAEGTEHEWHFWNDAYHH